MSEYSVKDLKDAADKIAASLDALREFLTSIKIDNGALRTSEPFRIAREGGPVLAVSTTAAFTDKLAPGLYHITSDTTGVYIAIGETPTPVTDGHDYRMVADGVFGPVEILTGERIGAIVSAGTANLYYHRVR